MIYMVHMCTYFTQGIRICMRILFIGERNCHLDPTFDLQFLLYLQFKGVVNSQNSRDKGPPEGNSADG